MQQLWSEHGIHGVWPTFSSEDVLKSSNTDLGYVRSPGMEHWRQRAALPISGLSTSSWRFFWSCAGGHWKFIFQVLNMTIRCTSLVHCLWRYCQIRYDNWTVASRYDSTCYYEWIGYMNLPLLKKKNDHWIEKKRRKLKAIIDAPSPNESLWQCSLN